GPALAGVACVLLTGAIHSLNRGSFSNSPQRGGLGVEDPVGLGRACIEDVAGGQQVQVGSSAAAELHAQSPRQLTPADDEHIEDKVSACTLPVRLLVFLNQSREAFAEAAAMNIPFGGPFPLRIGCRARASSGTTIEDGDKANESDRRPVGVGPGGRFSPAPSG